MDDVVTEDVSASGLSFVAERPHWMTIGDRVEVRLHARVEGIDSIETLVLATDAIVTRAEETRAALRFEAPFAF